MHAVILAAGRGSRMGPHTDSVPKAFLEVGGRSLYARQRDALAPFVSDHTVVLGYQYENVIDDVGSARVVLLDDWEGYENAESLRLALGGLDDDVLVMNGDIVASPAVIRRLVDRHDEIDATNVVGCLPGVQTEHTAIRCDDDGAVTDYGMIPGRRHAGLGIIDRANVGEARALLSDHSEEWYPVVYPETPTRAVTIPGDQHVEINRPADLAAARDRLPFAGVAGESMSQ